MPPPALPIELTDAIIDHLHADRAALRTCTLVRRAWRGAAQHRLLVAIFCVMATLERLLTQLEATDGPPRSRGDGASISASFGACVREVWLRGPQYGCTTSLAVGGRLARVLAALPNLHALHLEHVWLAPLDACSAGGPRARRCRLRQLDLPVLYQVDTWRLTAMLALCAEVQKLTLGCVYGAGYGYDHDAAEAEDKVRCETLVVDGRYPVAFEVRRVLQLDALKAYEVKLPQLRHVPIVLEMLGAAAGSLESLTLHLNATNPASAWMPIRTVPWAALTHLSLILCVQYRGDTLPFAPITLLLSYFPQTVRTVELRLVESSWTVETLQGLEWGGLETQLLRFTGLQLLTVCPYPDSAGSEGYLFEMASKGMPTLAARGLLAARPPAQMVQG